MLQAVPLSHSSDLSKVGRFARHWCYTVTPFLWITTNHSHQGSGPLGIPTATPDRSREWTKWAPGNPWASQGFPKIPGNIQKFQEIKKGSKFPSSHSSKVSICLNHLISEMMSRRVLRNRDDGIQRCRTLDGVALAQRVKPGYVSRSD